MTNKVVRTARERTNIQLEAERATTDDQSARRTKKTEDEAAGVLRTARDRASDVLRVARWRADDKERTGKASRAERRTLAAERSQEDEVLRKEFARADEVTANERSERARLLAEILANDRQDTDESLLLERGHADEVVARRDEFLGMVRHDLRNELGTVALNVASILQKATDDEHGRAIFRAATTIQRTNLRMSRLIGDLLDVISIEVGKFTVLPGDHDVRRMVSDVVESFAPIAAAKGISLTIRGLDRAASGRFDHQRVQQVLSNLVINALKFTAQGGSVALSAERRSDAIRFSVADDGCGITADRLETIFDRFSQGPHPGRNGLGLGLYIARSIVAAHGGRIWAQSRPGHGSTFYFTLPIRAQRRRSRKVETRVPQPARNPRSRRPSSAGSSVGRS